MAKKTLPSRDVLRQLIDYDADTGKLYWKSRDASYFNDGYHSSSARAKQWNAKNAGKEAFTAINSGYRDGAILNVRYLAHRVIWKIIHDEEPDQIDHINGNRQDNRICNLRSVSSLDNKRNMCIPSHNTSGVIGVSKSKRGGWESYISIGNKKKYIGTFYSFEDAVKARKDAEIKYGFHENHGRKA